MHQVHHDSEEIDQDELPVIGSIQVIRTTGYGTVADLDGEEPADIHEIQCMAAWQMYAPLLALPGRYGQPGRVVLDADGEIDWDRIGPAGRRQRRPQQRRTEGDDLRRVLGLISLLMERIPGTAKYTVLRYVRMGILDVEHVTHVDLRAVAQLEIQARQLQQKREARTAQRPDAARARRCAVGTPRVR